MSKYNFDSIRADYLTPPEIYQKVLEFLGIDKFNLDVCCSNEHIPAEKYYKLGEYDGLMNDWEKFNWCNPPYCECEKWVKKAYEEQQKDNTTVMLIPVRTETKYWHKYILKNEKLDIIFLLKGTKFLDPETKEPMGIFKNALCIVYFWGDIK